MTDQEGGAAAVRHSGCKHEAGFCADMFGILKLNRETRRRSERETVCATQQLQATMEGHAHPSVIFI